ncbi:MAG: hypothetical protein ACR2QC_01430 [Gammaproteobacteria bacterium]
MDKETAKELLWEIATSDFTLGGISFNMNNVWAWGTAYRSMCDDEDDLMVALTLYQEYGYDGLIAWSSLFDEHWFDKEWNGTKPDPQQLVIDQMAKEGHDWQVLKTRAQKLYDELEAADKGTPGLIADLVRKVAERDT